MADMNSTLKYIPPGLSGNWKTLIDGGSDKSWLSFDRTRFYTNAFVVQDDKVLLGYKKRGFGSGKYNGFGGKVEPGETALEAATRELEEEAGVLAPLEHAGVLFFLSEGADFAFHIDIYRADSFTGTISESDEMRPEWFSVPMRDSTSLSSLPSIPFDKMWDTDLHWLPLLLARRPFVGRADFRMFGERLLPCKWWFGCPLES